MKHSNITPDTMALPTNTSLIQDADSSRSSSPTVLNIGSSLRSESPVVAPNTLFPSIGKLSDFIGQHKYHKRTNKLPSSERLKTKINLTGTVKLHGTHVDLVIYHDDTFRIQSRKRSSLTIEQDNHDCAKTLLPLRFDILELRNHFLARYREINRQKPIDANLPVIIAGEWCGPKVQAKVALAELPTKIFVILSANINGDWVPDHLYTSIHNEGVGIYNISRAPSYREVLDVLNKTECQERIEKLVWEVEQECPFAKTFGISGIGEGIVWKAAHPLGADAKFWFKTKGEGHQVSHTESVVLKKEKKVQAKAAKSQASTASSSTAKTNVVPKAPERPVMSAKAKVMEKTALPKMPETRAPSATGSAIEKKSIPKVPGPQVPVAKVLEAKETNSSKKTENHLPASIPNVVEKLAIPKVIAIQPPSITSNNTKHSPTPSVPKNEKMLQEPVPEEGILLTEPAAVRESEIVLEELVPEPEQGNLPVKLTRVENEVLLEERVPEPGLQPQARNTPPAITESKGSSTVILLQPQTPRAELLAMKIKALLEPSQKAAPKPEAKIPEQSSTAEPSSPPASATTVEYDLNPSTSESTTHSPPTVDPNPTDIPTRPKYTPRPQTIILSSATPREKAEIFASACVLEPRLQQGMDYMIEMNKPLTSTNAGAFLKWLCDDIFAEEESEMRRLGVRKVLLRNVIWKMGGLWWEERVGDLEREREVEREFKG